jgi:hypothetical protein
MICRFTVGGAAHFGKQCMSNNRTTNARWIIREQAPVAREPKYFQECLVKEKVNEYVK